jgi:hypothetical protein
MVTAHTVSCQIGLPGVQQVLIPNGRSQLAEVSAMPIRLAASEDQVGHLLRQWATGNPQGRSHGVVVAVG